MVAFIAFVSIDKRKRLNDCYAESVIKIQRIETTKTVVTILIKKTIIEVAGWLSIAAN